MKIVEGFASAKRALSRQKPKETGINDREQTVRQIVHDVRDQGDAALLAYTEQFDGVKLTSLEIDKDSIERAYQEVDAELISALELAAERITGYHEKQKSHLLHESTGNNLGWLLRPLSKVGVHAPGFMAPLPSSLLMAVIPTRVAGVREVILATPPGKPGRVSPVTLAAAKIAGVDRVFSVGGAQAIAALAFGTESVPRVDKVCGPGNIFVSLAKKMVYGIVGIDGLYGPSEVIIIADDTARPEYCAADLLAQAEHGSGAVVMLITTSKRMAERVNSEIERRDIAAESLESHGLIVVVADIEEAIELANLYAPEHLCLVVKDASDYVKKVENAGCLFVGENSIESVVDYVAGPSHVLPTEGTARFGSGLNVMDFVKFINLVNMDEKDIRRLGKATSVIARAEGLNAHARAIERRLKDIG
jgi:histidinol dehydrogenase